MWQDRDSNPGPLTYESGALPIALPARRCDTTKPTMWLCDQHRLRSAWASAQSDQSLSDRMEVAYTLSYALSI